LVFVDTTLLVHFSREREIKGRRRGRPTSIRNAAFVDRYWLSLR
jgi:hypothetical protein